MAAALHGCFARPSQALDLSRQIACLQQSSMLRSNVLLTCMKEASKCGGCGCRLIPAPAGSAAQQCRVCGLLRRYREGGPPHCAQVQGPAAPSGAPPESAVAQWHGSGQLTPVLFFFLRLASVQMDPVCGCLLFILAGYRRSGTTAWFRSAHAPVLLLFQGVLLRRTNRSACACALLLCKTGFCLDGSLLLFTMAQISFHLCLRLALA